MKVRYEMILLKCSERFTVGSVVLRGPLLRWKHWSAGYHGPYECALLTELNNTPIVSKIR